MNGAQFVSQKTCYLCGSSERCTEAEVGTGIGEFHLRWVRCRDCSLVYLDPRPSTHALSVLYDSGSYWQGGANGYHDYLADEKWRRRQAVARADWFAGKLRDEHGESQLRVLEIGSAAGYFLEALSSHQIEVEGLELSRPMVRLSQQRVQGRGLVRQGFVEEAQFDTPRFQGLAAWGCDSNFDNPRQAFASFARWLAPQGLLTMNFHQHDHWARALKGRFKKTPNALYFFNAGHIRQLLDEHGFELLDLSTEFQWMSLASVFHHTGHSWLRPLLKTPLADVPLRLPVLGSYRFLARKL